MRMFCRSLEVARCCSTVAGGDLQILNCILQVGARGFELVLDLSNPRRVARGFTTSSDSDGGATRWQLRAKSLFVRFCDTRSFGCGRAWPACRTLCLVIVCFRGTQVPERETSRPAFTLARQLPKSLTK